MLLGTRDLKRMLAYSSVEQMGILSIGAALGAAGIWAALFQIWGNTLTKGALFMSAGNIRRAAGGRTVDEAHGMAALTPRSAFVFVIGMFAATACPPFSIFFSELAMVRAAFANGHGVAAAIFLVCLFLAFIGFARLVFTAVDGRPGTAAKAACKNFPETAGVIVPAIVLMGLALGLGIWTPAVLRDAWSMAVAQFFPLP
jgi:hydrogenase-4 component F